MCFFVLAPNWEWKKKGSCLKFAARCFRRIAGKTLNNGSSHWKQIYAFRESWMSHVPWGHQKMEQPSLSSFDKLAGVCMCSFRFATNNMSSQRVAHFVLELLDSWDIVRFHTRIGVTFRRNIISKLTAQLINEGRHQEAYVMWTTRECKSNANTDYFMRQILYCGKSLLVVRLALSEIKYTTKK